VLSPLLYALFINGLALEIKKERAEPFGVDVFGRQVGILLYADDIVLIADSPEQLQNMLACTELYARQWQFRFNTKPGKSDVVICGTEAQCAGPFPEFRLGEGVLNVSKQYKYLGVEMGLIGRGSWSAYLDRAIGKAQFAANQLAYSVTGRSPLQMSTSVHLFKALVRPVLEYGAAIWGPMCCDGRLNKLESLQEQFGRRLLRLHPSAAGEYVRCELGLESVAERVSLAVLRFYGRLTGMPDSRLAGFVFRQRCAQVDRNEAKLSWCWHARQKLQEAEWSLAWRERAVPENWKAEAKSAVRILFQRQSEEVMHSMSTLELLRRLGPASTPGWLDSAVRHPGAAVRLKLRSGGAPIMQMVGARHQIPRDQRTCKICGTGAVETAEHFAAECPAYAAERAECLRRLDELLGEPCQLLPEALVEGDVALFLGDGWLQRFPPQLAQQLDATVCNFLKMAWKARKPIWQDFCCDGNEWQLKPSS